MITDNERREVAERLRTLADGESPMAECSVDDLNTALGFPWSFTTGIEFAVIRHLADLIDRPTCEMTECSIDHGSRSWGMRCSRCDTEFEHEKPAYGWRYCPKCGAMVVEKDGDDD